MISISNLYSKFRKSPSLEAALTQTPQFGAGQLMVDCGYGHMAQTSMVNIAASFLQWWRGKNRTVWRVTPETAKHIQKVSLSFIPETPPSTWSGDTIVIESLRPDQPFIHDVFSLTAYRTKDMNDKYRYFFTSLSYPDGASAFSISCDLFKINKSLAVDGSIFGVGFINDTELDLQGSMPHDKREFAFDIIRFVFALSYYIASPEHMVVTKEPGPPARNDKKKPIRKNGKPVSLWNYATAKIIKRSSVEKRGTLDKNELSLEPVIVSPHIRRHKNKIIIIDQYDSHRWRRGEKIGTKKTI